jgi:hypothetical protein
MNTAPAMVNAKVAVESISVRRSPLQRAQARLQALFLDLRSILKRSTYHAQQVQDHHDDQERSDYSQTPARAPSGIPVIAASSTEQQQQNDY